MSALTRCFAVRGHKRRASALRRLLKQPGFTAAAVPTFALGIHGVPAYLVSRRTRRLGVCPAVRVERPLAAAACQRG